MKCLVQNIVIDVSFSQLGGLCTLCFLEQVELNTSCKDLLYGFLLLPLLFVLFTSNSVYASLAVSLFYAV